MKLVLYSGGSFKKNLALDRAMLDLCPQDLPIKMALIPSQSYQSEYEYLQFIHHYSDLNIDHLLQFPVDIPIDPVLKKEVFDCNVIHLGGGNTFYFLYWLKKTGILGDLFEFVQRGGVLCGTSAGAIMMSPTVEAASFPDFDCDENEESLRSLKSLGLVPFDFFPHYEASPKYDRALKKETLHRKTPLWAATDGSGIVINNDRITFLGEVHGFIQGKKTLVKNGTF